MTESILNTVKLSLPMDPSYTAFDTALIVHINTVLNILSQVGLTQSDNFTISDETATWDDLLGTTDNLQMVKTYVCLKTKLLFDPPANSAANEAIKNAVAETEWRINYQTDGGGDQ